ncbi:DUF72 domain-containing protein [Gynuella sp.]|uniref:DUF72 domain-containing protein n=1 Tax=Gynuella sp. TaxID=2969146 RepID=UPI003D0AA224
MQTDTYPLRLGMAMWSHSQWRDTVYGGKHETAERLARYSEIFSTVEGNTTFYATPHQTTARDWSEAVANDFRFTFKFPQEITHKRLLRSCSQELQTFLHNMSPLMEKTGLWKIQLPKFFGPAELPLLQAFMGKLPKEMNIGVEVRHDAFFAKGADEQQLNRLLMDHKANRIIMDSRPVFAAPPDTPAIIDAQKKKPRVPVHAIATAKYPVIRFIGHPTLDANNDFFHSWIGKICQWITDGCRPYLFIHTPDNIEAPTLARELYRQLSDHWLQFHKTQLPVIKTPTPPESNQLGLAL